MGAERLRARLMRPGRFIWRRRATMFLTGAASRRSIGVERDDAGNGLCDDQRSGRRCRRTWCSYEQYPAGIVPARSDGDFPTGSSAMLSAEPAMAPSCPLGGSCAVPLRAM